jgi:hypothetical protein
MSSLIKLLLIVPPLAKRVFLAVCVALVVAVPFGVLSVVTALAALLGAHLFLFACAVELYRQNDDST